MKIVAFGYKSRSGKDTASRMLVTLARCSGKFRDVRKSSFAKKLKAVAHDLFGIYGLQDEAFYEQHPEFRDILFPALGKTPVELWIAVGDTMKRAAHDGIWRDHVLKQTKCDLLVLSDLRYVAEAQDVKAAGGICVKVNRESAITKGSDSYLDGYQDWDFIIENNSTLGYLQMQVENIFERFVLP